MNSSMWAVKCELINYSYQYVQKKCLTPLDTNNLKHLLEGDRCICPETSGQHNET